MTDQSAVQNTLLFEYSCFTGEVCTAQNLKLGPVGCMSPFIFSKICLQPAKDAEKEQ